jgi:D-3-phosphoglycerate dehydrogenase
MKVVITDAKYPDLNDLERPLLDELGFDVALAQCTTEPEVVEAGRDADALAVQYAPITRNVLEALPNVRIVSRYGVGVDNIDLAAAHELGVWIANVPDYCMEEVAVHALGMALALIRHLPFYDRDIRAQEWYYLSTGAVRRPSTMTFGVVGHGRIGSLTAQMANPCFGRVLACDPYLPASVWPDNVQPVDHDELFSQSDVVSLHVPLTEETRNMVDRRRLVQMPTGSFLVNTARGAVVNVDDLVAALDSGHLSGAGLDVLPREPMPRDHAIMRHPRVLLSPHSAFFSAEAEEELRRRTILNIVEWAKTGRPPNAVVEGRA